VVTASAAPAKGAEVTLAQAVGSGGYSVDGSADAAGRFDIPAVPAGSYIASAEFAENADSNKQLMGRTAVQIGDTNIDSLEVMVYPGATVSAHVRVEGDRKINLGRTSASLKALENSAAQNFAEDVRPAQVQADGTLVFHDVPEGTYRVVLNSLPDGYYVRGPAEDGAAETSVLVSHGHAAPVEIRFSVGHCPDSGYGLQD
jgi:hypothetical protein